MTITKIDIYGGIIIVILCVTMFFMWGRMNTLSQKYDTTERTITALHDSIHVAVKNGITTYSKLSPEVYLSEFVKSAEFKALSKDQQSYYDQLNAIKGLLSATSAQLEMQGSDIASLKGVNAGVIKNDSVDYKLGTKLAFAQVDTSKKLKWSGTLSLDAKPTFDLVYDYSVNIKTDFDRQKDKSIVVNYHIDDPDLKITKMLNYTIPAEQKRTKFGRWAERNRGSIGASLAGCLFLGGGYVGYKLAK
jgi:hypothetical protein